MSHVGPGVQALASDGAVARSAQLDGRARASFVAPLGTRLLEFARLREVTGGLAVAAVLLLLFLGREILLGRLGIVVRAHHFHIVLVESLLVGYLVAARMFLARAARETLDDLVGTGHLSAARDASARSVIGRYPRALFLAVGLAGAFVGALAPLAVLDAKGPMGWERFVEISWRHALAIANGWLVATYVLVVVRESRRISGVARDLENVNLFDSGSFAPFGRFGVQAAFTTVGVFSVMSLMLVERGFAVVVASVGTISVVAAATSLLLPLRGARDRICEERERELACCRVALRDARDALGDGRMVTTQHGHLSEVVVYTRLVESVREWPLDMPTILQVASYLLLPIASWLSGALGADLADRMVAAFIG